MEVTPMSFLLPPKPQVGSTTRTEPGSRIPGRSGRGRGRTYPLGYPCPDTPRGTCTGCGARHLKRELHCACRIPHGVPARGTPDPGPVCHIPLGVPVPHPGPHAIPLGVPGPRTPGPHTPRGTCTRYRTCVSGIPCHLWPRGGACYS